MKGETPMTEVLGKTAKRVLASLVVFIVFVYASVFICKIPGDYTIKKVDGHWTATYTLSQIVKQTNDKFLSLAKFDLGKTQKDGKSLDYLVKDLLPKTLQLLFGGLFFGTMLGIFKGILDSKRGKSYESGVKILSTIIPISLPDILIICLLQKMALFLYTKGITIFKVAGSGSVNHMLLPVIALSIMPACYIARITAMAIDECYEKDYIKAAIGKGCSKYRVLWNHAMRNAVPAIIESLPSITFIIIGNLMMVEYMFYYNGLTQSLMGFFKKSDSNGIVANVILIGVVYFLLDTLFRILKSAAAGPMKEGGV